MERETGFEPATPTLARSCSTTELFPPASGTVTQLRNPNHLAMSIRSLLSATLGPFRPLPGHTGGTRRPQCARFLTHGSQPGTRSPRAERTAIPRSKAPPTTSPRCRYSTPLRREGRSSGPLTSPKQRNIWGVPDVFLRCRRRRVPQTGFRGICRGGRQAQRGSFAVSASRTGRRHARLLEAFDRDGRPAPLARRSSVSQKGPRRAPDKSWPVALSREELTSAVHDNLKHLGLETLDVVNLRVGGLERPTPGSIAEPFTVLAEFRRQGLIRHLGVSNVSAEQLTEARSIAPVVCVQNNYNVATRYDRELVDRCAGEGIAYTPFLPLGGFTPLQSAVLDAVAAR